MSTGSYRNGYRDQGYMSGYPGGGVPAPPPTPPTSGLVAWWKADAGVTLSGSNVTGWADQSGNGHNIHTIPSRDNPAFLASAINGLPGLNFATTNSNAILGAAGTLVAPGSARYVVAVVQPATGGTAGQTYGGEILAFSESPNFNVVLGEYGPDIFVTGQAKESNVAVSAGTPYALEVGSDGTTVTGFINGTALVLNITTPEADNGTAEFFVGADFENSNGTFWGVISELLVYSLVPSSPDITALRAYVNSRYGL